MQAEASACTVEAGSGRLLKDKVHEQELRAARKESLYKEEEM